MKIMEAAMVKRIEFKNREAKERYFQDLRIAGKAFYCLEDGSYKDENGNQKHVILIVESCGRPLIKYIKAI